VPPSNLKDNLRKRTPAEIREERDILRGWIRQPEVHWLDPSILAKAGVEVAVSGTFGKFADKREIQTQPQGPFRYLDPGDLWIDYLSDTGDGWAATQTMAWLLAQPRLTLDDGTKLERGRVLLLGGDQVYPSATPEAYEDRFKGPFAAALPQSDTGSEPHMFATPGNHDWYDGLVSFLRLFCADGWIGGWRTRQRRSYFALELPNDWWIWAIDIQLDTYIDNVQLEYFKQFEIKAGDKVILMTAKPSWASSVPGRVEPPSWRFLNFFEERMIRDRGARLVLTITGDRHHYARYQPKDGEPGAADAPTRITAGGGGAYLSGTHTLPEELVLQTLPRLSPGSEEETPLEPVVNRRAQVYPRPEKSKELSGRILKLAALNPAFAGLFAGIYALIGVGLLRALSTEELGLLENAAGKSFFGAVYDAHAGLGLSFWVTLLLLLAAYGGTDIKPGPLEQDRATRFAAAAQRSGVALVQTVVHVLLATGCVWLAIKFVPEVWENATATSVVGLALAALVGFVAGTTWFAAGMLFVHRVRAVKAQSCANQVFTGQSIADYKNLLRMRLGADGTLTIHPLGVDTICREWKLAEERRVRFIPRGDKPEVHLIDEPLRFDADGNRLT
jgi:hypothetical protein